MPLGADKSKEKKDDTIMGDATDRLLIAAQKKILREQGRLDYDELAREGFSPAMIARLQLLQPTLGRRLPRRIVI